MVLKAVYNERFISGFNKINTIKENMFDIQTTITGYALGRIFLFQKEAVSQVSMGNSNFC